MKGKSRSRRIKSVLESGWSALFGNIFLIIIFIVLAVAIARVIDPDDALQTSLAAANAASDPNASWLTKLLNQPFIAPYMRVISEAFKDGVAVSVIIVDVVILCVSRIYRRIDSILEEEIKSNANHHAIIWKYSEYKETMEPELKSNYFSKNGEKLLCWQSKEFKNTHKLSKKILKEYLGYAGKKNVDIKKAKESIDIYINGKPASDNEKEILPRIVELPDICVFANWEGNINLSFKDNATHHELPDFIESHAVDIMRAHKTSKSSNKLTMRLNDISYDGGSNTLTFITKRTNYIHMMLTNRCMDFPLGPGLSVRELYEYRDYVLPLDKTILANQIGVEGLIITTDGYTLIEKRSHKHKTTWRNKFAQPISLSMSCKSLGITGAGLTLEEETLKASEAITKMISGHLKGFGLLLGEDYNFDFSKNFLGVSRDLVEGGKPNIYFYVVVNKNHDDLNKLLRKRAESDPTEQCPDDGNVATFGLVGDENFKKRLYLYPIEKIDVNYNYIMEMDMVEADRVCRRRKYTSKKGDNLGHRIENMFWNASECIYDCTNKVKMSKRVVTRRICLLLHLNRSGLYKKECAEAFLGCLAFYRMCKDRIDDDYKNTTPVPLEEENNHAK